MVKRRVECHDLKLGLATKARAYEGASQKWSQEAHFMFPEVWENVKEWTPYSQVNSLWELDSQWTPKFLENDCRGQKPLERKVHYIIGNILDIDV
jgi:hypothetical protein